MGSISGCAALAELPVGNVCFSLSSCTLKVLLAYQHWHTYDHFRLAVCDTPMSSLCLLLGDEVLLSQEGFRERSSALVLVTVGFGLENVSWDPKSLGIWAFQVDGVDIPCLCMPNSGGEWEDTSYTPSEHPHRKWPAACSILDMSKAIDSHPQLCVQSLVDLKHSIVLIVVRIWHVEMRSNVRNTHACTVSHSAVVWSH